MTASGGDAVALASALRGLGFACDVEARGALALLSMRGDDAARLAASADRAAALALAKEHGFTHVAVEVEPERAGARATVLRD
jgi:transposase